MSIAARQQIEVAACGSWAVTVNGEQIEPLHSRLARELLVRMSLVSTRLSRDQVLAELRPSESNARAGRRRLSQELSRAQNVVGVPLWESTRDHIAVRPDCVLTSDVSQFLAAARPDAILDNDDQEFERLAKALCVVGKGDLLLGHTGEWAEAERETLRRIEARVLGRAVPLARSRDCPLALEWALRKTDLDPFDEQSHAMAVRLLRTVHGTKAAESYVAEIEDRFVREMGAAPTAIMTDALREPTEREHPILGRVDQLVRKKDRLCGNAGPEQVELLLEIDDLLREAGHQDKRTVFLDELASQSVDRTELAWRQAEVAVLMAMPTEARAFAGAAPTLDYTCEGDALLATMAAATEGSNESALGTLDAVIAASPTTRSTLEATLALAFVHDQRHDVATTERLLLQAWDTAETKRLPYYRAASLCQLGWVRTRAGDHLEAQSYLKAAVELSEGHGADGILADARGALAYRYYQEHLMGSALRCIDEATTLCLNLGRVASEMRWRNAGCVIAHAIGDVPSIRRHHDRLRHIVEQSPQTGFQYAFTLADTEAILHEYDDNHAAALAIQRDLFEQATDVGAQYLAVVSQFEVARLELALGDVAAGLATAKAMVDYAATTELPPGLETSATAALGIALTANDQPDEGIVHLRRVAASNQTGLPLRAWYLTAFYHAAMSLGRTDEAHAVLVKAGRYVAELCKDLTAEQWATAIESRADLAQLMAILPDRP